MKNCHAFPTRRGCFRHRAGSALAGQLVNTLDFAPHLVEVQCIIDITMGKPLVELAFDQLLGTTVMCLDQGYGFPPSVRMSHPSLLCSSGLTKGYV